MRSAGAVATDVPVPTQLGELAAASGRPTLRLTADGAKQLTDIARELIAFDAFLADSQLEMDGNDLQQPTPCQERLRWAIGR